MKLVSHISSLSPLRFQKKSGNGKNIHKLKQTRRAIARLKTEQTAREKAAGLAKGGQEPGRAVVGQVTMAQVREIADQKMGDMNAVDVEGAMQMVVGSARAMGLEVVEG